MRTTIVRVQVFYDFLLYNVSSFRVEPTRYKTNLTKRPIFFIQMWKI